MSSEMYDNAVSLNILDKFDVKKDVFCYVEEDAGSDVWNRVRSDVWDDVWK